jgi:hypothetical protein
VRRALVWEMRHVRHLRHTSFNHIVPLAVHRPGTKVSHRSDIRGPRIALGTREGVNGKA